MKIPLPTFIRDSLARVLQQADGVEPLEKIDGSLTPNMRALRLVMSIAEQLLSQGVAASDVVHMCLYITDTYCERRVHIDVISTMITVSQDRGDDREPLTLIRTIIPRDANYRSIQALQSLVLEIRDKHIPLKQAEKQVDDILRKPKRSPRWLICAAGGALSAGVVILYDGSLAMSSLAFAVGFLATGALKMLGKWGLSSFYSQIIAALCITLTAAGAAWLNTALSLNVNPTLLVIGGIVLLVAGMMIVGAFQDAIDEYYITANARLLKVAMATGGIVIGVLMGLFVATRLGISFPATPDRLPLAELHWQYIGAFIIAAAFVAQNHAPIIGALVSGSIGIMGWLISRVMLAEDFGIVVASAVAAATVGIMATFVSRFWRFPSIAIISAGVVPLVPGLSLYNGLMGIVEFPTSDPQFMEALSVLMRATMIGLAVAAGATLGSIIGRPLRKRVVHLYNSLPRRKLDS